MSHGGRRRGRGYGRGKYFESSGPEHSYPFGRGSRGRGFYMDQGSSLPPPQAETHSSNIDMMHNSQNAEQRSESPQPVFTPQPELDFETQSFQTRLRRVWNLWKKSENVSRMLQEYFTAVKNPYESAFKVAVTCPDFYQGKPMSLPVAVIEELAVFLKNKKERYALCLTHSIKFDVFLLFTKQRNNLLTKLAFDAYDLRSNKDMFIEPIKEFIRNQQYKEACQSATFLGLDQFHIEDFVIPLLLQDKLSIAEDYLNTSPSAQAATAEYLDRLLGGKVRDQISEVIRRLRIPDPKKEKFQYKPMSKLLARFLKIYNLPPSSCPNLTHKRREGALHFVIRKRYKYNELNVECWREMATEAVRGDEDLERLLVEMVNYEGDVEEAAHFANEFRVPYQNVPYNVAHFIKHGQRLDDDVVYSPPRVPRPEPEHVLRLPANHLVTMVDNDELMGQCVKALGDSYMVGIDTEWKPALSAGTEILSLLQISTHHETFLIDVIATHSSPVWKDMSRLLFNNSDILKLGFGLSADLLKLKETIGLNDVKLFGLGYLDLNTLWKKLMREFNVTLPFKGEESDSIEGLSKLVSLCLGVPLDKNEQFSNWERRPLRDAQMNYAALDAYCLLEVYEVLYAECTKQGVPFLDVSQDIMVASANSTKKSKKKNFHVKIVEQQPPPNTKPIRVKDLSVVCDTMLQGLGTQLRTVGIDAKTLKNTQNHNDCVALSNEENRVILTKGTVYNKLLHQVPAGMCYRVEKGNAKEQLVEVLNYYNVIVTKEDIFSRCQLCNNAEFKKLTPSDLKKAIDSSHRTTRIMSNYELGLADDDYDDYGGFSDGSDYSDDDLPGPTVMPVPALSLGETASSVTEQEEDELTYGYDCKTSSGAHIKHESIPKEKFNEVPLFYICDFCGHCYWDGSHLERILGGRLKHVVEN